MEESFPKVWFRFGRPGGTLTRAGACAALLTLGGSGCSHVRDAIQSLHASVGQLAEQPAPALEPTAVATTAPAGTDATPSTSPSSLRTVVVNGKRLERHELAYVDMLDCGVPVPDGNYWMSPGTRTWGYVSSPEVHAFPACNADPVVQHHVDQDLDRDEDSDSNADELSRIRRSTEMSRYQTEIDRMENNGGMYVPSR